MDERVPVTGIAYGPSEPEKRELARRMRAAMTPAEARLWTFLRANRLCGLHFRRQQILFGYVLDFYCHAAALVVEVDGPVHAEQTEYDAARDERMTAHGLSVVRVTNEAVFADTESVLRAIRSAALRRVPHLPDLPTFEP